MFTLFVKTTLVPLLLRIALAAIFIYHGLALVGGPEHEWGAHWGPEDLPAPAQLAVAWGELLGGIAMAIGLLTRLAGIGLITIMGGAIATVHGAHGFDLQKGGFEYNFTIIIICLCLVLGGPGMVAVDHFFRFKRKES